MGTREAGVTTSRVPILIRKRMLRHSSRVLAKAGATHEACCRQQIRKSDKSMDVEIDAVLRQEWSFPEYNG